MHKYINKMYMHTYIKEYINYIHTYIKYIHKYVIPIKTKTINRNINDVCYL